MEKPNTITGPAGEQPATVSGAPAVKVEPNVSPAKVETNVPPVQVETNVPPAKETPSAPRNVLVNGVRGAPLFELADVRAAIEAAMQASVAWDTSLDQSDEQRTVLTERFYVAFAQLSETVTYPPAEPETKELVSPLHDVLKTFAKEPKKLAMIGNRTSAWLDQPTRPNQGIFIFGTVKQIKPAGPLFETELELAALKQRTITVVSRVDPRQTFSSGDRILMLGAIVVQPGSNLLGYEGKEPMVVMGGFPVLLQ